MEAKASFPAPMIDKSFSTNVRLHEFNETHTFLEKLLFGNQILCHASTNQLLPY